MFVYYQNIKKTVVIDFQLEFCKAKNHTCIKFALNLPKVKPEIMEDLNIFTTTHQPASIRAI